MPKSNNPFQVNGSGRGKLVGAKKVDQLEIIPGNQCVYFSNAQASQMGDKFINQLLADAFMLTGRIDADGIEGCLFLENAVLSDIEFPITNPAIVPSFSSATSNTGK